MPTITPRRALPLVALAAVLASGATALAARPGKARSSMSVSVDSFSGAGEFITARSDEHGVRAFSASWPRSMVRARIGRFAKDVRVGGLQLSTSGTAAPLNTSMFVARATGSKPRSIRLVSPPPANVEVVITAGSTRATMRATGFPRGVTRVELTTTGRGARLLGVSAPCRRTGRVRTRRVVATTTLQLADGSAAVRRRQDGSVACR